MTGATGFVGEHIYSTLVEHGFDVICGTRHPTEAAKDDSVRQFCQFDLDDPASVARALSRVDRAIYLAHSMGDDGGEDFLEHERRHAETFRDAAAEKGLDRIVYLGGMRPAGELSRHLESRLMTGEILRGGKVPTIELRATMILGGGSESFRIVRDLAARLPVMILPKWLENKSQPVAIADIGEAIAHALEMPIEGSVVYTAPGPETLSGRDIILRTAELLGQKPKAIEVPLVTPRLSSYWIRLVTRANPDVARELVEGLRSDIVSQGKEIWTSMPDFERTPFDRAVTMALREEEESVPPSMRIVERALHGLARA
ncbi:MAG TPA: NAD(P)H-binding protein [Polyangiaceae bacterium]